MSEFDEGGEGTSGEEREELLRRPPGIAGIINPNDPGWQKEFTAAAEYAWDKHHKKGSGEAVYKADVYVKGDNPISGYLVILTP